MIHDALSQTELELKYNRQESRELYLLFSVT